MNNTLDLTLFNLRTVCVYVGGGGGDCCLSTVSESCSDKVRSSIIETTLTCQVCLRYQLEG